MKIFSLFDRRVPLTLRPYEEVLPEDACWSRDPLSHPLVEHMSERELADLPFRMTATPSRQENCRSA